MGKKIHLKKGLLTIALVIAPACAFATNPTGSDCNNSAIQANAQAIYTTSLSNYNTQAPQPGALDGCLGSLSGLTVSIGSFDLNSILSAIGNQVCLMASSTINNTINGAIGQINSGVSGASGGLISVGSGGSGVSVGTNPGGANSALSPVIGSATGAASSAITSATSGILGK